MDEDYYKLLGVSRNASEAEIQKAYRKMASKFHPDLVEEGDKKQAKERFQQVQKAYDVLSDSEKRELYDRYGSSFETMGAGGGPGAGWQAYHGSGGGGGGGAREFEQFDFFGGRGQEAGPGATSFEEIFRQFTSGGGESSSSRTRSRRSRSVRKGADITHELTVPLKTAVDGGEARLSVRRPGGKTDSISVKIPAGIEDGKKIRLRGQGEPSPNGGAPGDILIVVRIDSHPHFQRKGNDLIVRVPITIAEAALGAKVDLPSPRGTISLTIPAGTSSGNRLRVKGMGVQSPQGTAGDLYAEAMIVLPEKLDEQTKELIKQLDSSDSPGPRSKLHW